MAQRQEFSSTLHAARFAAGLLVMLVHFLPLPLVSLDAPAFVVQAMNARNLTSSFFFVLSGFLVVITAGRGGRSESTGAFIVRRLARLWPAHAAGFAIMIPTAFLGACTVTAGRFFVEAALWLSMLHGFIPALANAYNGPAWAVTSFALGYVLAPSLLRISQWPLGRLLFLTAALWLVPLSVQALLIFSQPGPWDSQVVHRAANSPEVENLQLFLHTSPLFRLPEVAAGGVAALVARRFSFKSDTGAAFLVLLFAATVYWVGSLPGRWLFLLTHAGLTPMLLFSLVLLWRSRGWLDGLCDRAWIRRGGQAGILLYFLHRPVFTVLDFLCRQLGGLDGAVTQRSLPLALAAAAASVTIACTTQPAYDRASKTLAAWILARRRDRMIRTVEAPACSES